MATSLVDAESVLTIDLGSVNTRVSLFDVVEGQYHFIANGVAPSTVDAPFRDVGEGVFQALDVLQQVTGRALVDSEARIIVPSKPDGSGVDRMLVTISSGPMINVVAAGLLPDVSVESVQNLVKTTYAEIVETISLRDRRRSEEKIDAILSAGSDLIILAGGTESGANRSVLRLAELVLLVCRVLPQGKRPAVLYAGNKELRKKIKAGLEKWTTVYSAPNLRPSIDVEDIGPAEEVLNEVIGKIRTGQIGGLESLGAISSASPMPAAHGFGRMVRFLGELYDPEKGVLGVDLGASNTTLAASVEGNLSVNVYPMGMGKNILKVLEDGNIQDVLRWVPMHISESYLRDYIWQKSLYPGSIPMDDTALAIEQAVAKRLLQIAVKKSRSEWPGMFFEPILASGSVLNQAASRQQSLMMLLDGLQPVGITTLILDQNGVSSSLGAISQVNSILPVQVLESRAFRNLGTVICPVTRAKYGSPVLQVRLEYDDGNETQLEIRQGTVVSLPLQQGQTASIYLNPLRKTDIVTKGKRGSNSFKIVGGICGAVIDARGRPIVLPTDDSRRRELLKKWYLSLGS